MALDKDQFIEDLKGASISDLNDLVKAIEDEFGVSAAAPVAAAGAAGGAAEAKTSFNVELTGAGSAKIKVDNAPTVIKEDLSEDEANDMKAKLEEAGATVEVK